MDKSTARQADTLLWLFSKSPDSSWHTSHIEKAGDEMGIPRDKIPALISLFLHDGILERVIHPGAPDHDFGVYGISHKGLQFIRFEGGYVKKRRFDAYEKTNTKFTWIRHWVWFYTAVASLLVNLYFILKYLAKWL